MSFQATNWMITFMGRIQVFSSIRHH